MDKSFNLIVQTDEKSLSKTDGQFTIEPLSRGYGITLGNAMRRVLLTSIPGAAITHLQIEGVDHEFSTLKGVKDDVADIIMNLKKVRFKLMDNNPDKIICAIATPSKLQIPGSETLSPVILHPPQESVTPNLAMNGITNIPCRHIGFKTGSDGSKTANSYNAIEPAQPDTNAVCIKCTAINRPGSFNTTV